MIVKACLLAAFLAVAGGSVMAAERSGEFRGAFYAGRGDAGFIELLDTARRMFSPDPVYQNMSMLYRQEWNGLVEGPTWDAWWIQNSYGTTYCALPFYEEPFVTFLQNAQDLWFDQMGDGKRAGANDWVAPDGCLCDCARPGWVVYRQGDGRIDMHDWGMEFTAAGVLMQSELLLISRDLAAIRSYLPKLERSVEFVESRRDREKNLFLAGPAGNLLAPSYAGWKKPDGTYGKGYLTGLSVTYIAALDRMIELQKMAGDTRKARIYAGRRASALDGLKSLTVDEGYLVMSMDPDGVKHGVFGAPKHGYFETSPNHDAVCFRVVDQSQSERIYSKMASIPGLRPHNLIIPNYPSYDDTYEEPKGLWEYGRWVNGGHWSTCEARMMMGYYRVGMFDDARRSMEQILTYARKFRMDNPLSDFGASPYQPAHAVNLTYDAFGIPAALIRGLFEYVYTADGLTLIPHIPPGITELEQRFPIRFGEKKLFLAVAGSGGITSVSVNGKDWPNHDAHSITLPYDATPAVARVCIAFGGAKLPRPAEEAKPASSAGIRDPRIARLKAFIAKLEREGLPDGYAAAHARLAVDAASAAAERAKLKAAGTLPELPPEARAPADEMYESTVSKLVDGLGQAMAQDLKSGDAKRRGAAEIYRATAP